MQNNKYYLKKERKRKLNKFNEFNILNLTFGVTFAIFLVIIFNAIKPGKEINPILIGIAGGYFVAGIMQLLISLKVKKDILKNNDIKDSTRKLGFILIVFILSANIFSAISGFTLIKKDRGVEYNLSIYMTLISVLVIFISGLNLFKEYVPNTYNLGMIILSIITIFYVVTMYLIHKFIVNKKVDSKLKIIAYLLILSSLTGNVFAFVLGLVILSKLKQNNAEVSIGWIDTLRRLFRNNMAILGMFAIIFLLSISICSKITFDYSLAIDNNYSALLLPPSLQYPFGTDDYGRCVFTRIVFGARISLIVGMLSTLFPIVVGGLLGSISGYYGNKVDNIIMRILDILYAIPGMLLAIAIVAVFGANTFNLILALSVGGIPMYARTVRATVLSISSSEFVEAAKACGAKDSTIILKHIIPNSLAPIIVRATLGIGTAVLATSGLSYLGLGVEPHIPEWGNILKVGSQYLETNPYLAIYPGLAIILIVLSFNFFGDGLRDALDPKLK